MGIPSSPHTDGGPPMYGGVDFGLGGIKKSLGLIFVLGHVQIGGGGLTLGMDRIQDSHDSPFLEIGCSCEFVGGDLARIGCLSTRVQFLCDPR